MTRSGNLEIGKIIKLIFLTEERIGRKNGNCYRFFLISLLLKGVRLEVFQE